MGKKKLKAITAILLAGQITASSLLATVGPASLVYGANLTVAGTPYDTNGHYDATVPHIIINQVYGGGLEGDSEIRISHGFIELYNPADQAIDLQGWSLQYADRGSNAKNGPTTDWKKLDLTGTIAARSSFLVLGKATNVPGAAQRLNLDLTGKADQNWDIYLNNKGMKVVLLNNTELLPGELKNPFAQKPEGYVDMIGTASNDKDSDIDGFETAYPTGSAEGTSKKKAIRRIDMKDTDNNKMDFQQVEYFDITSDNLALYKPRSSTDGAWRDGGELTEQLSIVTSALADGYAGKPYQAQITVQGGKPAYKFSATGLPEGLSIDANTGIISGTPSSERSSTVTVTVTDSAVPAETKQQEFALVIRPVQPETELVKDLFSVTKVAQYKVGVTNKDGGVAEIVKYNKDNGSLYLVNGSTNPPSLDIIPLNSSGNLAKSGTVNVKAIAEENDPAFVYGDLTSVDVNTLAKRIAVSVQHADPNKNGKILILDYAGKLIRTYEAGVQPDMITSTSDGRYILTADEAEPRGGAGVADPEGSITIVDTKDHSVKHVKFDNPDVIDDLVHIRGVVDGTGLITGKGTKADALFDLEPEYITISEDGKLAYVSLQENNAVATIDIAQRKVLSVKGLGYKDLSLPQNSLDMARNNAIELENAPFFGMYMPDGLASKTIDGTTYIFTANEGDATDWPNRKNGSTVGALKSKLNPESAAARFLANTDKYDKLDAASDMGNDGIYLYGGRSFSIWDSKTMQQVFDSSNDFERITAERLPDYFNVSNDNVTKDHRSTKKGPEPEDIKVGKVGSKYFAFTGLERIGGVMFYDVTDPSQARFANYTNTREFNKGLDTDTGPEGLEFIPATASPTGLPLLLVAHEVGGTVAVYQMNVTKVELDTKELSLKAGGATEKLSAAVSEQIEGSSQSVIWSSSDIRVAKVNENGVVTPVSEGNAVITAISEDGYGIAESKVTVSGQVPYYPSNPGGASGNATGGTDTAGESGTATVKTEGSLATASLSVNATKGETGEAVADLTADGLDAALKTLIAATPKGGTAVLTITLKSEAGTTGAVVRLPKASLDKLVSEGVARVDVNTDIGTLSFDKAALASIAAGTDTKQVALAIRKSAAGKLAGEASGANTPADSRAASDRPVYELTVTKDGKPFTAFGGGLVQVGIPYSLLTNEDPQAIVIYARDSKGELELVRNGHFNESGENVSFVVNYASHFVIGYNKKSFVDTGSSFASPFITYLSSRQIIEGVGGDQFAPKANISRADFTLILSRIGGIDKTAEQGGVGFSDVSSNAYYANAVQWAASQGIVNGAAGGKFDPNAPITREQLAAMLQRFADAMKVELPKHSPAAVFADQSAISDYAKDAVAAMQQAGIVAGKSQDAAGDSSFSPKDYATREEAAKMLALIMQLVKS
ncbi:choice-of-anchor I family protein [Paenibacillus sp. GCM10012307]|uniref:Choice-of-anchor I family protein n=1 Tax=Paenibacillus roseus TaxID=2798579 RepID=A0A934J8Y9_9BACL|nr:choice-of-anchor I family protein [Paenibacillus roseus]MBJ6364009.1 choice-of-anchor I family protein [Paenibacillus roseus]